MHSLLSPEYFQRPLPISLHQGPLDQPTMVIDEMEWKWLSRVSPSPCPSQPHPAFQDNSMALKWLFDFRNMSSRTKVHAKLQHPSFWLITFLSPHCIVDLNLFLNHCNFLALLSDFEKHFSLPKLYIIYCKHILCLQYLPVQKENLTFISRSCYRLILNLNVLKVQPGHAASVDSLW